MRTSRPEALRSVLVLSLGGTIAMTAPAGAGGGVTPRLTGADLIGAVPGLDREAAVTAEDFRQVPSASLSIDDVADLAARLNAAARAGTDGFVITQGTDTLEETAFLLDLLYDAPAPLVLTGAMRNPSQPGADGPANLLAAVRTAASPAARDLGALVVFADEIHAARYVRKTHATSIAAFTSPGAGPIGQVVEGSPKIKFKIQRKMAFSLPWGRPAEVEVVAAALGGGGAQLDELDRRADGAVIAACGAGHGAAGWVDRLAVLAAAIPVVLCSRTGAGSVLASTYGFPGSERDLLSRALISGGALGPYQARLLLIASLRSGASRAEIETAFADRG